MASGGMGDFTMGRGRGVLGKEPWCSPGVNPVGGRFSTPYAGDVPPLDFGSDDSPVVLTRAQVRQMSTDITNSIKQDLLSGVIPGPAVLSPGPQQCASTAQCGVTTIDASKINLVLRSQVKEPPYFRGDNSDKCSIFEWEELMRVYLNKREVEGHKLVGEVVDKLMGRARDITKVWLRNNSRVSERGDVNVVFNVLKQHFGDAAYSAIPLADFYATKPRTNESPLDYWVRLNKAAEVAEQCLESEGRSMPNQSMELAVMFIRNCPSKELSLVFMSKPQREWTASQVQDRLDEFLREHKVGGGQLSQHAATTVNSGMDNATPSAQSYVKPPVGVCEPERTVTDRHALDEILGMLEKALISNTQSARGEHKKRYEKHSRSCAVCQSTDHGTIAHCKLHRLCFQCFSPGHAKAVCQANAHPRPSAASGAAQADLSEN